MLDSPVVNLCLWSSLPLLSYFTYTALIGEEVIQRANEQRI